MNKQSKSMLSYLSETLYSFVETTKLPKNHQELFNRNNKITR